MSKVSSIDPKLPVALAPVHIAKPWGQEIWYTGMEKRGVSQAVVDGNHIPLDDYLATNSQALCDDKDVLLLKILDPAPAQVTGDLYFEVHDTKQEVYVVTAVDDTCWPDGTGAIRLGMCQNKRRQFPDDATFRAGFLQAVQDYEFVRRRIDAGAAQPGDTKLELELRADMEAFSAYQRLKIGDVVKVPTWTPHALQHGVRVVEFQTATYERLIISFAQQVLTQDHWDSAEAISHMNLDTPQAPEFSQVQNGIERIVEFDDFNVWRCTRSDKGFQLPQHLPYAVCMAIGEGSRVGSVQLQAEQACFVPTAAIREGTDVYVGNNLLLIAAPGL